MFCKKEQISSMKNLKKMLPIFLAVLLGCKNDEIKITADERIMIDTMSANQVSKLRGFWIRDCELKQDSMVQFAIDSITTATLQKINKKLKPYHE